MSGIDDLRNPWPVAPSGDSVRPPAAGQEVAEETLAAPGVAVQWLFSSPAVAVTRWRCRAATPRLSPEKRQLWHVIAFTHGGSFQLHTRSGTSIADSTSVVFYNPGAPYETSHPCGCGDHGSALVAREDVLRDMLARYDPAAHDRDGGCLFPRDRTAGGPSAYAAQRLLVERLATRPAADPLEVEEEVLALAALSLRALFEARPASVPHRAATARQHADAVEAVQAFLQSRYREPLRLATIAAAVDLSPYHLSRIFRDLTGLPVHRYVNRLRLRHALDAVAAGAKDLTDLALESGFSSHSHFTAAFRSEFGFTPSTLRQLAGHARRASP